MSTFKLKQTADEVQVAIDNGLVAVTYGDQELDEAKKAKARSNISAASQAAVTEALGEYTEEWIATSAEIISGGQWNTVTTVWYETYGFRAYLIPCEPGDLFLVSSASFANAPCAMFYSGEPSSETYIGFHGQTALFDEPIIYVDELVEAPAGCRYVGFNDYTETTEHEFSVKKKTKVLRGGTVKEKADAAAKHCVEVTYSNSELTMKGADITLVFGIASVNNTFTIKKMVTNKGEKVVGTDMASPYTVCAVNDVTGTGDFITGGYHGTENGVGNPTARCESYTVYVDGEAIESVYKKLCNYVLIDVVNYVEAGNTFVDGSGREVLKETIHYKFDGSKLYITTEIEALEDLIIRYYHFIMATGYKKSVALIGESPKTITSDFSTGGGINSWVDYAIATDDLGQTLKMHVEKTGFASYTSSQTTDGRQFYWDTSKCGWNLVHTWGNDAFALSAGEKTLCTGYWDWCPSNVIG